MPTVEVNSVVKSYGGRVVVDNLSFAIYRGEVFGLIGPNGAGKTTTIRMITGIVKPDSGRITVFGERMTEDSKNSIGYLPEERGLYRKLNTIDCIAYLSSLKGVDRPTAEARALNLLSRMGMASHLTKKTEALSHGMAQIVQFVIAIVHDPQLVILDEPFSALDPVNAEVLKTMIHDLRNQGKAIVLSTHRMNEVEELCDRILMVDHGRSVLFGTLSEIKSQHRGNSVVLECQGQLEKLPGVAETRFHGGHIELALDGTTTPQQILEHLVNRGVAINRFEVATPTLYDIFLRVAGGSHEQE